MTPTIDQNDLQAVVQIIDICSRRGAFEGSELAGVAQLRAKVLAVLEAEQEKPEEAE